MHVFFSYVLRVLYVMLYCITGVSCYKYHFCRDEIIFVATKVYLSQQTSFCRDKHTFVAIYTY